MKRPAAGSGLKRVMTWHLRAGKEKPPDTPEIPEIFWEPRLLCWSFKGSATPGGKSSTFRARHSKPPHLFLKKNFTDSLRLGAQTMTKALRAKSLPGTQSAWIVLCDLVWILRKFAGISSCPGAARPRRSDLRQPLEQTFHFKSEPKAELLKEKAGGPASTIKTWNLIAGDLANYHWNLNSESEESDAGSNATTLSRGLSPCED